MDKKYVDLLNKFANDHVLATHIKVDITSYCKSFKPREKDSHAKYEDANLLSAVVTGAEYLCYYLQRNGYKITKKKNKKK